MFGVGGKGELGMIVNGYGVSFWVDRNTVNLGFGDSCRVQSLKTSDCTIQRVHFMVCKLYLQIIKKKKKDL